MTARRGGEVVLWFGLAMILVATRGSSMERNRRILNELGDIPTKGNLSLPYNKRQQIIYLLNKDTQSKRDKQPRTTVAMENFAKELSLDGNVVIPNTTKLLVSEEFHSGGLKEVAVNKGDGPPNLNTETSLAKGKAYGRINDPASVPLQKERTIIAIKKSGLVGVNKPPEVVNISSESTKNPQVNLKRTETHSSVSQSSKQSVDKIKLKQTAHGEESSILRKKDSFIRPIGRLFDGELLPPLKPINPNVFEIGQDEIHENGYSKEAMSPHSGVDRDPKVFLPEERPARRRWRDPWRWRHRHHYHHRPAPLVIERQPNMYYMPMYSGRSDIQMLPLTRDQGIDSAPLDADYGRQPVMMHPLVPIVSPSVQQGLPLVQSQPVLQSPYVQQPDAGSSLYTVPLATAPQQPQQVVYPFVALPALQQPQPQVQLVQQPAMEQGIAPEHVARHWADETGHSRSEVTDEEDSKPREYDDERKYDSDARDSRYDDDRYHEYKGDERRYHDDRENARDEEDRKAEQERLYRERDYYENSDPENPDTRYEDNSENANARSAPLPVPATEETPDDDNYDEESESEENEHILQDSNDEPFPTENDEDPAEIERDEASPNMNYRHPDMPPREDPSVIQIPSYSPRMHPSFAYPSRLSVNTYAREQLLGPSAPVRERVLPRFMDMLPQRTPIESPNGEISEMSASEARFRERMRLELQAKDTIPRGFHSHLKTDGLNNVVIRLNGEPLENASELRSRIIDGRIIQGKGKVIKSKGPMRIRVTHKGKGRNRIKFIDIISPQKYSISDSRSKIGRVSVVNGKAHYQKRNQIHRKTKASIPQLRAKSIASLSHPATTTTSRKTKVVNGLKLKRINRKRK